MKDGTGMTLKSLATGKLLTAVSGGGGYVVADNATYSINSTFRLWRLNATTFNLRTIQDQFVGVGDFGRVVATSNTTGPAETFTIVRDPNHTPRIRIKASNGFYLRATPEGSVVADSVGSNGWSRSDPSVFNFTITWKIRGDYQLANGYGPYKANEILKEHYNTYIVEDDFKYISENGLNGVRIPVGWWMAYEPNPPNPYINGSLQFLDNAFIWAEKYNLKIVIDLHAVMGGISYFEHSGTRDGAFEWGQTKESVQKMVDVVEFFAKRYAKRPSFYAVEVMNEPLAPGTSYHKVLGAPLDLISRYYRACYDVVRKHSQAYVIMSPRIGRANPAELLSLASTMEGSVLDYHFYNLFFPMFRNWTAQQNIDFIRVNRTWEISEITYEHGPLIFVGEWAIDWYAKGATKEDYINFTSACVKAYDTANFGWAFWNYKAVKNNYMNLRWMIENGYIDLKKLRE